MFSWIKERTGIGLTKFHCMTCKQNFATRKELSEHMDFAHPGDERANWEKPSK